MSLEALIEAYGYPAVALGTFLEGELVLLLAGFLAYSEVLDLRGVMAAGLLGSVVGDHLFFFLGRRYGNGIFRWRPHWQARAEYIYQLLDRHYIPVVLGFRFVYGLRIVTPVVLGMSRVPTRHFVLLNVSGAVVWTVGVSLLGYFFGAALALVVGEVHAYLGWILAGLAAAGLVTWAVSAWRTHRRDTAALQRLEGSGDEPDDPAGSQKE